VPARPGMLVRPKPVSSIVFTGNDFLILGENRDIELVSRSGALNDDGHDMLNKAFTVRDKTAPRRMRS
jgi:CBS domain containing-hemolysin-like protein